MLIYIHLLQIQRQDFKDEKVEAKEELAEATEEKAEATEETAESKEEQAEAKSVTGDGGHNKFLQFVSESPSSHPLTNP